MHPPIVFLYPPPHELYKIMENELGSVIEFHAEESVFSRFFGILKTLLKYPPIDVF